MEAAPPLTLCSHPRLAYGLQASYDQDQRLAGQASWEAPPICTLGEWLESLWMAHGDRMLLTSEQESFLWREIIAASSSTPLLDVSATAASAAEAWRLAHAWHWDWKPEPWESEETSAFRAWSAEFARRLDRGSWISAAQLPAAIVTLAPPFPDRILLAGFDLVPPTPQWQALLEFLAARGVSVEHRPRVSNPAQPFLASAPDPAAEIELAAVWARQRLEQGSAGPISVVIPDLAKRRAEVERIFAATLHPDLAPWDPRPRAFHLSLGAPLAAAPMVETALSALSALLNSGAAAPLDLAGILDLVRSPFLAAADAEALLRARLEQTLRDHPRPVWRWSSALHFAQACPVLSSSLARALAEVHGWPARQSHQAWIESFSAAWEALGWPGERALDSAAWQTRHAWERLLDDFGRLDQVAPASISALEAIARLRRCAEARIFQPQAVAAPVQIVGWLEAAGLTFSELWVAGLDDATLPAPAHPNPFLPLEWQRGAGLPRASAASEAATAALLWNGLIAAAPVVLASYPRRAPDGHELRPSPLLAGCPAWSGSLPPPPVIPPPDIEPLADLQAAPPAPAARRGRSELLRDQSACPFRAFAHFRLHARGASDPSSGLAASTRGTLLHKVLAALWRDLGASTNLVVGAALRERIAALAADVLANEHALDAAPGLREVECQRLTDTVYAWCDLVERHRPAFRVLATEESLPNVSFAGLELDLRRDRVDQLASGGRVLLDYKSGYIDSHPWDGDRPKDPQLPLYLLVDSDPDSVVALAFARVRAGEMEFAPPLPGDVGASGSPASPGVSGSLGAAGRSPAPVKAKPDVRESDWRRVLEALAAEYLTGYAAVAPRDSDCCHHCDLHPLCRIRDF
ncbi:MAG: PD-(D/E)XK nuclease family protein [Terriglobales bacterium]